MKSLHFEYWIRSARTLISIKYKKKMQLVLSPLVTIGLVFFDLSAKIFDQDSCHPQAIPPSRYRKLTIYYYSVLHKQAN